MKKKNEIGEVVFGEGRGVQGDGATEREGNTGKNFSKQKSNAYLYRLANVETRDRKDATVPAQDH